MSDTPENQSVRQRRIVNIEPDFCPRRGENPHVGSSFPGPDWWQRGTWAATKEEADAEVADFMARNPRGSIGNVFWNYGGEQPRTCSYCGGVHPDDATSLIEAGWEVDATTKSYKRYLEPPGYRAYLERLRANGYDHSSAGEPVRSPVPPVKLYTMHFSPEQIETFNAALRRRHV